MTDFVGCGGHCHCDHLQAALCNARALVRQGLTDHPLYVRAVILVDAAGNFRKPHNIHEGGGAAMPGFKP